MERKMAYMDQEKKAKIAETLKLVVPKGWKYHLSVKNHSVICFTLAAAPVDLIGHIQSVRAKTARPGDPFGRVGLEERRCIGVNQYFLDHQFEEPLLTVFRKIVDALNMGNYDRSHVQSDYFDVGHYVDISIGRWDKPFVITSEEPVC
jgi:hypothetical protein